MYSVALLVKRLGVQEHGLKSNHNNKARYTYSKCNLLELFQAMLSRKEADEVCNGAPKH